MSTGFRNALLCFAVVLGKFSQIVTQSGKAKVVIDGPFNSMQSQRRRCGHLSLDVRKQVEVSLISETSNEMNKPQNKDRRPEFPCRK